MNRTNAWLWRVLVPWGTGGSPRASERGWLPGALGPVVGHGGCAVPHAPPGPPPGRFPAGWAGRRPPPRTTAPGSCWRPAREFPRLRERAAVPCERPQGTSCAACRPGDCPRGAGRRRDGGIRGHGRRTLLRTAPLSAVPGEPARPWLPAAVLAGSAVQTGTAADPASGTLLAS